MLRDKKQFNIKEFKKLDGLYSVYVNKKDNPLINYGYLRDSLLMKYTQGDNFREINAHYETLIDTLVKRKEIKREQKIEIFKFKFLERDVYPLLAFAIALPISDDTWNTLISIFPEGRDYLTDKLIATHNPERTIAGYEDWRKTAPYHFKYFKLLGESLETENKEEQIKLVNKQLRKWRNKGWRGSVSIGSDPDLPKNPCYYGQFAYEVAAVVMAFDIDDSSFKEDIYYPKELVEYFRENH